MNCRTSMSNAAIAGWITFSFLGCSLPTGKYAQANYGRPVTGSRLGASPSDVDPSVALLSRTSNGITNPGQVYYPNVPTFGETIGPHGN
jgi:hypothetical protein